MNNVCSLPESNPRPLDHQPIMLTSRVGNFAAGVFGVFTVIAIVGVGSDGVGATKVGGNKCFCGGASFGVDTGGDDGVVVLLTVSFENTDFSFFLRLIGVTCVYPCLLPKAHFSLFFIRIHF